VRALPGARMGIESHLTFDVRKSERFASRQQCTVPREPIRYPSFPFRQTLSEGHTDFARPCSLFLPLPLSAFPFLYFHPQLSQPSSPKTNTIRDVRWSTRRDQYLEFKLSILRDRSTLPHQSNSSSLAKTELGNLDICSTTSRLDATCLACCC